MSLQHMSNNGHVTANRAMLGEIIGMIHKKQFQKDLEISILVDYNLLLLI